MGYLRCARRGDGMVTVLHRNVIFTPHTGYTRYRVPLFIVHASDRYLIIRSVFGDEKVRNLDQLRYPAPSERAIYSCVDPDELCLYGDPRMWTIKTWNNRVSSMTYGTVKVYPLLSAWDETITDLFDFIDGRGVAASSLNTMSLNLWRSTLPRTVSFHEECPQDEMLGPVAMHTGGRKEARPGAYRNRVEYDIRAAYPHAMARPMPTKLVPAPASFIKRMDVSQWEGIAVARVRIPPMEWGPLPVVLDHETELTCYGFTRADRWATVTVPLSELWMAASTGRIDFDIQRCHIAAHTEGHFTSWLNEVVPSLRNMVGGSGTVGKLIANRLWSCFAVSPVGERKEHTFTDDGTMITATLPPDPTGQVLRRAATTYVGAIIQSRVRQRLWSEGLLGISGVVYVDTDGVIAKRTDSVPEGWRAKTIMPYVDIAGPQAYYHTCNDCLPPPAGHEKGHWVVAGAQSVEAKSRLFRLMKRGGVVMANIGNVLPAQDVNEYEATTETTDTPQPFLHLDTA